MFFINKYQISKYLSIVFKKHFSVYNEFMPFEKIIGYSATILICVAFIPQAFKVWQSKSVQDISIPTFTLVFLATLLWMWYAFIRGDKPLLLTNVILLITQGSILLCAVIYKK